MNRPVGQHRIEIERNREAWNTKPLLREIYADFYHRILKFVDVDAPGRIVEIGSGIGILKIHLPAAVCTDLFLNPSLDTVCDGYSLPFAANTVSHLILFDVFHHLQKPKRFLNEARRVLLPAGRLILFEPFISLTSLAVYGMLHHEPVAWRKRIDTRETPPQRSDYYAAQGNATRIFFRGEQPGLLDGWAVIHAEAYSSLGYLLSGGFSKPAMYPRWFLPALRRLDKLLSRFPRLFGGRCLIRLQKQPPRTETVSL